MCAITFALNKKAEKKKTPSSKYTKNKTIDAAREVNHESRLDMKQDGARVSYRKIYCGVIAMAQQNETSHSRSGKANHLIRRQKLIAKFSQSRYSHIYRDCNYATSSEVFFRHPVEGEQTVHTKKVNQIETRESLVVS